MRLPRSRIYYSRRCDVISARSRRETNTVREKKIQSDPACLTAVPAFCARRSNYSALKRASVARNETARNQQ